ncbi:Hypothetical predicted protein [Mytilus galloprovincialis]|uniref:DED domain-containing protein n=1 Tax=Mytilus galloprovincialis TaxID=29158 RepID=A0A8B6G5T1_MYTGA|nr:Hypothetical predicted protein [Mytilus galloprovincialis]
MDGQDVSDMKFAIQLNNFEFGKGEKFENLKYPSEMCRYLFKRNFYSEENIAQFTDLMDIIGRHDLVTMLNVYRQGHNTEKTCHASRNFIKSKDEETNNCSEVDRIKV